MSSLSLLLANVVASLALVSAILPAPLPLICTVDTLLGCYSDSFSRTFPIAPSTQPNDPFHSNMTYETCAYLCANLDLPVAGVEVGAQCFCTNSNLNNVSSLLVPSNECNNATTSACAGNPFLKCGASWRVQTFNYTCTPASQTPLPWQDPSLPIETRVDDLLLRLQNSTSIVPLLAQLTHSGADIYTPTLQLPRYIISQECLAGVDAGQIYICPEIPDLPQSSAFPQPVNMGNTFDAPLVRTIGDAISDEARAGWLFYNRPALTCMSPNLNVARGVQWGRNYETFSEDGVVIAALGSAYIAGLQEGMPGDAQALNNTKLLKLQSIPKHLGAYSVECYNSSGGANDYPNCPVYRSFFNAIVDDVDLRESYLTGWERVLSSSMMSSASPDQQTIPAQGLMCSYNAVNGVPMCGNGEILRDIVEGEWQAPGLVISDADAVAFIYTAPDQGGPPGHNFATSLLGAAVSGLLNGTTVSLEDDNDVDSSAYHTQLISALDQGLIQMSDIVQAVKRSLTPRFLVGLYDPPASVPWNQNLTADVLESAAHHALARKAAADSYVLLKNDGNLLPLSPTSGGGPKTIAVVGVASNDTGIILNRYTGAPKTISTFWMGIEAGAIANGATAVYGGTSGPTAIAAVAGADVAIVFVTGESEGESRDRERIGIPADQLAFVQSLINQTSTPLVLCVVSGGAVDIGPVIDNGGASAAFAVYTGGMEAGNGFADLLWGSVNPSAALATTIYRRQWELTSDFLNMSIRGYPGRTHKYLPPDIVQENVLFPFAYGLSYTSWDNELVSITPSTISAAELSANIGNITVLVQLTNRGERVGSRTVLCFLRRESPALPTDAQWPFQWLARGGIRKVHNVPSHSVAPSGPISFTIVARDVARWDRSSNAFVVSPGNYSVALRNSDGSAGDALGSFEVTA